MSVKDAKDFIKEVGKDKDLVKKLDGVTYEDLKEAAKEMAAANEEVPGQESDLDGCFINW